jgi:hypothetical protein
MKDLYSIITVTAGSKSEHIKCILKANLLIINNKKGPTFL